MCPSTSPIPAEIDMQTQLVAVTRCEEWGTVEGDCLPQNSIPPPPNQFINPLDECAIIAGALQGLHICHCMLKNI